MSVHRLHGRCAATLATLAAVAVPVLALPGSAQADPATAADIEKAVGVDEVPADYVILADTSGSMQTDERYAGLRAGLKNFVTALSPVDQLTLVTFDGKARVVHQGAVGRSPDAIVAKLPAKATGNNTDIGAALDKAVEALKRKDAPSIASVVLITDGQHTPAVNSPFPGTEGQAWSKLKSDVQAMRKGSLKAYAVPISGATGAALLGSVFARPATLRVSPISQLTQQMEVPKREARLAKVRAALAGEAGKGVRVVWSPEFARLHGGDNQVDVTLTSTTAKIPIEVTGLTANSKNAAFGISLDQGAVTLAPGASVRVPATVTWHAGEDTLAYDDPVEADPAFTLTATASSQWSATLAEDIGMTFRPALSGLDTNGHASENLGQPMIYHAVAAALVLLAAAFLYYAYQHPRLYGEVLVGAPQQTAPRRVRLPRRRSASLVPGQTGEARTIKARMFRDEGLRMLRLNVDGNDVELRPGVERTHRGVRFEWQPPGTPQRIASPSLSPPVVQPVAPPVAPSVIAQPPPWPTPPPPAAPPAAAPAPAPRTPPATPLTGLRRSNGGDDELPVIDDNAARID
jgi:Mg-chelatase subunit ChlD